MIPVLFLIYKNYLDEKHTQKEIHKSLEELYHWMKKTKESQLKLKMYEKAILKPVWTEVPYIGG